MLLAAPSASGGGEGNSGGGGESRMFPGLRMTEAGWIRFQSVEQLEHDAVIALKLFRAAANGRHKRSTPACPPPPYGTGLLARTLSQRWSRDETEPDAVGGGSFGSAALVVGGGSSLTFV
eukprot:scaffold144227_cov148-Phaeocystis_antarctica.AAC.1